MDLEPSTKAGSQNLARGPSDSSVDLNSPYPQPSALPPDPNAPASSHSGPGPSGSTTVKISPPSATRSKFNSRSARSSLSSPSRYGRHPRSAHSAHAPVVDPDLPLSLSIPDIRRSSSVRSAAPGSPSLPSPLGDFQSDNVLNAPSKPPTSPPWSTSPTSGPVAHVGLPSRDAIESLALDDHPSSSSEGIDTKLAAVALQGRRLTESGSYHQPRVWNPFAPPGVESWTRESWGKRKVALISGITGQGGLSFLLLWHC